MNDDIHNSCHNTLTSQTAAVVIDTDLVAMEAATTAGQQIVA